MFEFLEKLRQKSDKEKKRFAFLVSFLFSVTIFGLWFFAVYPSFKEQSDIEKKVKALESSPTESMASVIMSSFGQIKEKISEMKNIGSGIIGDSDYYQATSTEATTTKLMMQFDTPKASTTATSTQKTP